MNIKTGLQWTVVGNFHDCFVPTQPSSTDQIVVQLCKSFKLLNFTENIRSMCLWYLILFGLSWAFVLFWIANLSFDICSFWTNKTCAVSSILLRFLGHVNNKLSGLGPCWLLHLISWVTCTPSWFHLFLVKLASSSSCSPMALGSNAANCAGYDLFQTTRAKIFRVGLLRTIFCELFILAGFCESLLVVGGNFIQILGNFMGLCF